MKKRIPGAATDAVRLRVRPRSLGPDASSLDGHAHVLLGADDVLGPGELRDEARVERRVLETDDQPAARGDHAGQGGAAGVGGRVDGVGHRLHDGVELAVGEQVAHLLVEDEEELTKIINEQVIFLFS